MIQMRASSQALLKTLIEKITVFAKHFTVELKSGLTIEIEAFNKALRRR